MRITNLIMIENAIRYLSENQERIGALQEKIASTKQFQVASDNPGNASMALSLRSSLQVSQAYLETAQSTHNWMSASDHAFKQMVELANRAINLVTNGLNDTNSEEERAAMGTEMGLIFNEAIDLGNKNHLGNYIFSGYHITTKPFRVENGAIIYDGDNGVMQREISPGQTVTSNVNGDLAFRPFFEVLQVAQNALNTNDTTALRATLAGLDAALDVMSQYRATNGTVMRQVQATTDRTEKTQLEIKSLLSQREDVNMAEAISMLRYQETTYQAALEVGQRAISSLNLFDMLR